MLTAMATRFEKSRACPANETLLAYQRQALNPADADAVAAHLQDCEFCFLLLDLLLARRDLLLTRLQVRLAKRDVVLGPLERFACRQTVLREILLPLERLLREIERGPCLLDGRSRLVE